MNKSEEIQKLNEKKVENNMTSEQKKQLAETILYWVSSEQDNSVIMDEDYIRDKDKFIANENKYYIYIQEA